MITGRVDELRNNKVFGWAYNTDAADEHLVIRIMYGTQVLSSGVANILRPDLVEAGIGDGQHAFEIIVPPNISSFHGLIIIAQSVKAGEIALPIASNVDRHLDELFGQFSARYEEALFALKAEIDRLDDRVADRSAPSNGTRLPPDLAARIVKLEERMDTTEVFLMRIDEMVRKLGEQAAKKTRKRFLGIF
jgi:hypothetical protein